MHCRAIWQLLLRYHSLCCCCCCCCCRCFHCEEDARRLLQTSYTSRLATRLLCKSSTELGWILLCLYHLLLPYVCTSVILSLEGGNLLTVLLFVLLSSHVALLADKEDLIWASLAFEFLGRGMWDQKVPGYSWWGGGGGGTKTRKGEHTSQQGTTWNSISQGGTSKSPICSWWGMWGGGPPPSGRRQLLHPVSGKQCPLLWIN